MNIAFVGDIMLGRLVNEKIKSEAPEYPWGNTLSIFQSADVKICNLECVISDKGAPWSQTQKAFHFRSDEKNVAVLKIVGFCPISIANNHALDYSYEGLLRMTELLTKNGINYAGGGINLTDASEPAICTTIQNKKIGLIAFTDNEPRWEASDKNPGIFYVPIDLKDKKALYLFDLIEKTRDDVDILIVSAHWGPNWGYYPPKEHITFAHRLIDTGADVIFGHSGHVFRGIELYKRKAIFYCTGNFVDDYAVDEIERNDESFIFLLKFFENEIFQIELYPTVIKNFRSQLANFYETENIAEKMQKLCQQLNTPAFWNEEERRIEIAV